MSRSYLSLINFHHIFIYRLERTTGRLQALEEILRHMTFTRGMDDELEGIEFVPVNSPVGGSQSNVAVEGAIKRLHGQAKTFKFALEPYGK